MLHLGPCRTSTLLDPPGRQRTCGKCKRRMTAWDRPQPSLGWPRTCRWSGHRSWLCHPPKLCPCHCISHPQFKGDNFDLDTFILYSGHVSVGGLSSTCCTAFASPATSVYQLPPPHSPFYVHRQSDWGVATEAHVYYPWFVLVLWGLVTPQAWRHHRSCLPRRCTPDGT